MLSVLLSRRSGALALPALLALTTDVGCVRQAPADSRPATTAAAGGREYSRLTAGDLAGARVQNVYDAIAALRGRWLRVRGPDSFNAPSDVVVYLGAVRLGGVEQMRAIGVPQIAEARWLDGIAATARYGVGHGAGAIVLTPEPITERRAPASIPGDSSTVATRDWVHSRADAGAFPLSVSGRVVPISVSPTDAPGVRRAARDLRLDLQRVTGTAPALDSSGTFAAQHLVIVGTLGQHPVIDALVREGKLDVAGVSGKWEASVTQVVENPMPGVSRALVIAGSDRRGTIYGVYDLSAQIGVSPWHWWADVPVAKRTSLYVATDRVVRREPAVKYRGIFINDEAPALSGWAREKFGGVNHAMYEHMFELILRLRGNYLWPAMWGNAFADDDSLNVIKAHEYGIVMGTSHHEPLTRAQQEWKRYGHGPWNYEQNADTLRAFWRQGLARMGARENLLTMGMRGDGDEPMTEGANIALLERIVADQRMLIRDVTGKDPSTVPQLWALYKEVQEYYDRGMKVPDDITLLFADDNWGNIRRLPPKPDHGRAGGYGVYYHFDYVGGPRNYKWLNTNPIARIWEQMQRAHAAGADRIWIVNVGDLKPMEYPIQFFLDLAWDPQAIPAEQLPTYATEWAAQQFGSTHAGEVADLLTRYLQLASRRKPELLDPDTYSHTNFREAERVVAAFDSLRTRANALSARLPLAQRDAFYQLVQHPIQALANVTELYVTVGRNRLYASQGRAATNTLADKARQLFEQDAAITRRFNTELAGGKWNHMMDQTHIGYTYWQEPPRNVMPRVDVIQLPAAADMGVSVVEANRAATRRAAPPGMPQPPALTLPTFDPFLQQTWHVDVFNRGQAPFTATVSAAEPWVRVQPAQLTVQQEARVAISVDWTHAPIGTRQVPITVRGPNGRSVVVQAPVFNPAAPRPENVSGFVQGNGVVAIEAEHTSRVFASQGVSWRVIPGLGRTLSAIRAEPVTAPSMAIGARSPRLEYDVTLFDSGSVKVHVQLSPTLNALGSPTGVRYGISFDDEVPQVVNVTADTSNVAWEKQVADNIRDVVTTHTLTRSGRHVLKFWYVDPGVVLQRLVVEVGDMPPTYLGPPESFHRLGTSSAPVGPSAQFDWFEYSGTDPVYEKQRAKAGEFLNPIMSGWYPDPAITRVGNDYYLVHSTFAFFPGIPVSHSRDLVNWTTIGHVIDRPTQLTFDSLGISRAVFAPTIEYRDGTFYVLNTCVDCGGNFIVTATNPAGPWSDPVWLPEVDGIDPSIFFDDDGKAYILNNGAPIGPPQYDGHRAIWIQSFDTKTMKTFGPRTLLVNGGVDFSKKPIWIEGPHLLRKDGWYYLTAAEGGTAEGHSQVVLRSKSVRGPFEPFAGNPILTQRDLPRDRAFPVTSAGHANLVQTPAGDWWATFLATRPYDGDFYNTGRETFLMPVEWVDGWPIITRRQQEVPYVLKRPALPESPVKNPTHGPFTWRDEFDGPELGREWMMIRTPRERWYDFTSHPGSITLQARPAHIAKRAQPSWIGRRQQHMNASASTAMRFTPQRDGDKAGIMAFQNDDYFYLLAETQVNGARVVQLEQRLKGVSTMLGTWPVPSGSDAPLELRIEVRADKLDFSMRRGSGTWQSLLRDADGRMLSTKVATGFVGTNFGLYAYTEPR